MNHPDDDRSGIGALLLPRSVAVVGATPDTTKFGGAALHNLLEFGFEGTVYPVHPSHRSISGLNCVPSLADLPHGAVELAVMAVPSRMVLEQCRLAAQQGVRAVIVFASDLSESALRALHEIVEGSGMRLLGPNTSGLSNLRDSFVPRGASTHSRHLRPGRVAVFAQSGALSATISNLLPRYGTGLAYTASVGQQLDIDLWDLTEHAAADPGIDAIVVGVEEMRRPAMMVRAIRAAVDAGKLVVAIRLGQTAAGAAAIATHTGAIVGDVGPSVDLLRAAGALVVSEINDVPALIGLRALLPDTLGRLQRVAVMTTSGAEGALVADILHTGGCVLPPLAHESREWVESNLNMVPPTNPLDTGGANVTDQRSIADTLIHLRDRAQDVDVVLANITAFADNYDFVYRCASDAANAELPVPLVLAARHVDGLNDKGVALLRSGEAPVFDSGPFAARIIVGYDQWLRHVATLPSLDLADPRPGSVSGTPVTLPYWPSRVRLASAGLRFPDGDVTGEAELAGSIAARIGGPVALKLSSPTLNHKAAGGGVVLGLTDTTAVVTAADHLLAMAAGNGDPSPMVTVEAMVPAPVELLLGAVRDPSIGPCVVLGLGGSVSEAVGEVVTLPAPLGAEAAKWMLDHSVLGRVPLVASYRNAVEAAVVAFAGWLADNPDIVSVDINPLALSMDGTLTALDARIVLEEPVEETQ